MHILIVYTLWREAWVISILILSYVVFLRVVSVSIFGIISSSDIAIFLVLKVLLQLIVSIIELVVILKGFNY